MTKDQIIMTLIGAVSVSYGFIIKSIVGRIESLESLDCNPEQCFHRFDKIEEKQEKIDPVFTEIRVKLAKIETILEEMKKR